MNNKGFAITTILYGTLILFLMLLLSMLGILSTYKDRLSMLIDSNNGARCIINGGCKNPVAYAVYSDDDKSLSFYKNTDTVKVGDTYNGKTVTDIYTGFETADYATSSNGKNRPWNDTAKMIKKVEVVDYGISPISTAWWFYYFENCEYFDVNKLDVSNVKDMQRMFCHAGTCVSGFNISDLTTWSENVSNVENMNMMFYYTGTKSNSWSLDLSGWEIDSVNSMSKHYFSTGIGGTIIEPIWK